MKPLSICLVSQEYPPETGGGGIGTQTYLRAQGLTARGHSVHVIAMSWDKQDRTYNDNKAVIHRIGELDLKMPGYETSTYWLAYSFAVAQKLSALEKETRFDIIQFPEYGGEGLVYQTDAFAYRQAKIIVQMHGPLAMFSEHWGWPQVDSPLHRIGCFMEKTSLQYADGLLASTAHTARYCAKAYGVDTSSAGVVYSGIDVERFRPMDLPHDGGPNVLFVGTLVGGKGVTDVVRAVGTLKSRLPGIRLRVIGKAEPDKIETLQKLVDDCGIRDRFELVGYVPYAKLPEQYAWADVFAAPSVYEGGPGNVYLEAMACGKPVIACNTGGVPEVAPHGEVGWLIDPHDVAALENAIETMWGDEALRKRMAAAARAKVVAEFAVERYLDKCEGYYRAFLRYTPSKEEQP